MAASYVMYELRDSNTNSAAIAKNLHTFEERITQRLLPMMKGIKSYSTFRRNTGAQTATTEIWRKGQTSLYTLKARPFEKDKPFVLLIPSLINKDYVFNLLPERSLLKWMSKQDFNTAVLSWGEPIKDDAYENLETLTTQRLCKAITELKKTHNQNIHLLGYCLGGTLALAASIMQPADIKSLVLLAAPWDFHAGHTRLKKAVDFWASPLQFSASEIVTAAQIKTVFSSMAAEQTIKKFARFADMDPDTKEAQLFVAVEDWLNDGVDLPQPLVKQCLNLWFDENSAAQNRWTIKDKNIDLAAANFPVFSIASSKDTLVPIEMTPSGITKTLDTKTGHIGMIAGSKTIEDVWEPIADWLHKTG